MLSQRYFITQYIHKSMFQKQSLLRRRVVYWLRHLATTLLKGPGSISGQSLHIYNLQFRNLYWIISKCIAQKCDIGIKFLQKFEEARHWVEHAPPILPTPKNPGKYSFPTNYNYINKPPTPGHNICADTTYVHMFKWTWANHKNCVYSPALNGKLGP